MKRIVLLVLPVILAFACGKSDLKEDIPDAWNGYFNYYKQGEVMHTLWAGQNLDIGTVTYGIDDDANFYVHYDCSATGWLISESHMYAGDKMSMPVNHPGQPKVGRFPFAATHSPWVSEFTYTVPLSDLPPADDPGFVVAAHAVVHGPDGQQETAWAEGDYHFSDKGWGWYDVYYYNQQEYSYTILYGTLATADTLNVYFINVEEDTLALVFKAFVGDAPANCDAAAYDESSGNFFFANYDTGELWAVPMLEDDDPFKSGDLIGTPASGTFYDGSYYYVDAETNSINQVGFDQDWNIQSISLLSQIPNSVSVNDIAIGPSGGEMYIIGDLVDGTGTELINWEMDTDVYYTMSIPIEEGAQIAFGSDGSLYAIAQLADGTGSQVYVVQTGTGILTQITDGVIENEDPFSDISRGRVM